VRIPMIGAGYVGLASHACLAGFGYKVACVDTEERKIAALRGFNDEGSNGASTRARKSLECFLACSAEQLTQMRRRVGSEPEDERRESHRVRNRFERVWRHVDDQAPNLATANLFEAVGDRLNVPRHWRCRRWPRLTPIDGRRFLVAA
jgi:hypothetical protein